MARPLPSRIHADLFAQLAAMEHAGLPAAQAWGLLKLAGVPQASLQTVQKAVARGSNPAIAAQNAGLFTPLQGHLVRAALAAGSPAPMYQRLANTCAQRAQNESAIRSRMLMPAAILVLAAFIQGLPQLVSGALTPGSYLWQSAKPVLVLAGVAWLGEQATASASAQRVLCGMPLIGPALLRRHACNFFTSLAWLLEAGVAMFEALPIAVATIEHTAMRRAYARIKPSMQRGATLSEALTQQVNAAHWLGDARVIDFVATGESSGTLPEMLLRHTRAEEQALALFWQQVAAWLPRMVYAAVASWMAYKLLTGTGVGPRMPADL